jgi:hypothetical protein
MQPDLNQRLRRAQAALGEPDRAAEERALERFLGRAERAARRRRVPLVGGVALATVLAVSLGALGAERIVESRTAVPASRVVDRTLLCTADVRAGLRMVSVMVTPPLRTARIPSSVYLVNGTRHLGDTLVRLFAGSAPGTRGGTTGQASYLRTSCRPVNVRVPLATSGLVGGRITHQETQKCEVPRQIVVRVRARVLQPTRWNPISPERMAARGRIQQAAIAVRTLAGNRPLALVAFTETSAQLHVARTCWRD